MLLLDDDTICGISTAVGGALSVIRVSGTAALSYSAQIIPKLSEISPLSHQAYLCFVKDFDGSVVDQVLVTYFDQGKSYTGEEVVEISCHGSPYITNRILQLLQNSGCRLSQPGEFTFRAFMHNKLDLLQAEAVLSLIQSESKSEAEFALHQLQGHVSSFLKSIEASLTEILAHIEASIDFSAENLSVMNKEKTLAKLDSIIKEIDEMILSYLQNVQLKKGLNVSLVGVPNAGKSSLLNLLSLQDRSIVSPHAGTTRDVVSTTVVYEGFSFQLFDTAGIRNSTEEIEMLGVEKAKKQVLVSDVVCFVVDATSLDGESVVSKSMEPPARQGTLNDASNFSSLFNEISPSKYFVVISKMDKKSFDTNKVLQRFLECLPENVRRIVKDSKLIFGTSHPDFTKECHETRKSFFETALSFAPQASVLKKQVLLTARQSELMTSARDKILEAREDLNSGVGEEFVSFSLKDALIDIKKMLGKVYDDQIIDKIFKEFCLGK